jgi:hypothetical protein
MGLVLREGGRGTAVGAVDSKEFVGTCTEEESGSEAEEEASFDRGLVDEEALVDDNGFVRLGEEGDVVPEEGLGAGRSRTRGSPA